MCEQCEALRINGHLCHETGCPDAWKTRKQECDYCGQEFQPEERYQGYCSEECAAEDRGWRGIENSADVKVG